MQQSKPSWTHKKCQTRKRAHILFDFDYLQLVVYAYRVVICCDYDIGDLSWSVVHKRSATETASIASCVIALILLSMLFCCQFCCCLNAEINEMPTHRQTYNKHTNTHTYTALKSSSCWACTLGLRLHFVAVAVSSASSSSSWSS